MKKLLLLSLISLKLYAGIVEDLETTIIASDLPAVEQLLACKPIIDREEKYALIELATDILRERENMRELSNLANWRCIVESPKFNAMFEKRTSYGNKALISFLMPAGLLLMAGLLDYAKYITPKNAEATCVSSLWLCGVACAYYIYKYIQQNEAIVAGYRLHLQELCQNAIKIRQLLYKISAISD